MTGLFVSRVNPAARSVKKGNSSPEYTPDECPGPCMRGATANRWSPGLRHRSRLYEHGDRRVGSISAREKRKPHVWHIEEPVLRNSEIAPPA
jgi:hypothetical protein